jgi:hypothetical protein
MPVHCLRNMRLLSDGLHLTLSLFELRGEGEKRLACVIPIQNERIKEAEVRRA